MSGGVDSTACALKLADTADIQGFFMRLAQPDFDAQLARVETLARQIGISLVVIDLQEMFARKVLDYFADSYFRGFTPNPCMICNHEIKFGLLLEAILAHGMDSMATGHYARISFDGARYHLLNGMDPIKNQSYFLARLTQRQLAHVVFPLGDMAKHATYDFVKHHGYRGFDGIESQDVCFLANERVGTFLERNYPQSLPPHGPIISSDGRELGRHRGLYRYTIGQRRGLGLPDSSPWYVTGIDGRTNTLIVGKNDELLRSTISVSDLHWIAGTPPATDRSYLVKIRYSHRGCVARLSPAADATWQIEFDTPQRAITPGQFAVILQDDEVLGSGRILSL